MSEKGKIAGLVMLNEHPAADIRNTSKIRETMRKGKE